MTDKLMSIFEAITPDNIRDISVISDSMEIFIELLSEYSYISVDIHKALSENTTASLAEELPKIYLYDYYSMIENLRTNKNIIKKFRDWNVTLNPSLYPVGLPYIGEKLFINYFIIGQDGTVLKLNADDDTSEFNINPLSKKLAILKNNLIQNKSENYFINRQFKLSKGLIKSMKFIYDIINEHLVNSQEQMDIDIQETGNPFEFIISGSIDKDIYEQSVAYLAHPAGFIYNYDYISSLKFSDDYSNKDVYIINKLEVKSDTSEPVQYTGEVIYIIEKGDYKKIIFKDGFYLIQESNTVKYFNSNNALVTIYPTDEVYYINLDYTISKETIFTDEFSITTF